MLITIAKFELKPGKKKDVVVESKGQLKPMTKCQLICGPDGAAICNGVLS